MRFCWGVEACDEITVPAAVFTILVSIAFELLSTMGTYEGVICFLLNLLPVAVPPCHTALVGAEVFYFPTDRLHHDLAAVSARFATVEFWMAANMGADGAGWDAQGQGDFGAGLSILEHLVDDFDVLLFHG
jgi:hypothetical protein